MADMYIESASAPIDLSLEGAARVMQRVRTILSTQRGSVPLDREFGLDLSLLDNPQPRAMAMLRYEIADQLGKYEPAVILRSVDFVEGGADEAADGKMVPAVVVSL